MYYDDLGFTFAIEWDSSARHSLAEHAMFGIHILSYPFIYPIHSYPIYYDEIHVSTKNGTLDSLTFPIGKVFTCVDIPRVGQRKSRRRLAGIFESPLQGGSHQKGWGNKMKIDEIIANPWLMIDHPQSPSPLSQIRSTEPLVKYSGSREFTPGMD